MYKPAVFMLCSLLIVGGVVCWVCGVFGNSRPHATVPRSVKTDGQPTGPAVSEDSISVYFSPNGGCTDAIVREIGKATKCIDVQAAQFTSSPIAKALVAAKERGVDVTVVIDRKKDNEKSEADLLVDGGVPTFVDGQHHTAHNKLMLIDHHLVITGSFNFTLESEAENAENLLLIDGKPALIAAYEANFKHHLGHSVPYKH